ncbi:MAG: lipoate protein ligase C-terminal domain-containing protein [Candidatus Woesearchaeota archaeon]
MEFFKISKMRKEVDYKVTNGKLIRIEAILDSANKSIIKDIKITGDFFIHPENSIFEIENLIKNARLEEDDLTALKNNLNEFINKNNIKLIGFCIDDLMNAIKEFVKNSN